MTARWIGSTSEYGALLGSKRLIATHCPAFLIELNEPALRKHGNSSEDVERLFHEAGYQGWTFLGGASPASPARPRTPATSACLSIDSQSGSSQGSWEWGAPIVGRMV
jgi:hypothetical protein